MIDCRHNDHGHLLLWLLLVFAMSDAYEARKEVQHLEKRVEALEQLSRTVVETIEHK